MESRIRRRDCVVLEALEYVLTIGIAVHEGACPRSFSSSRGQAPPSALQ
jgi:hypothetical protein